MNDMIEAGSIREKTARILGMDDEERARQSEARFGELANGLSVMLGNALSQMSQQLAAQFEQQLGQMQQAVASHLAQEKAIIKQIADTNGKILAEMNKPNNVSLSDIQTDSEGKITGATVRTGMMQ